MNTLNEIADAVHSLAREKGWHEKEQSEGQFVETACNNQHNEVSELHEAYRNGTLHSLCDKAAKMEAAGIQPLTCMEEELADQVIRALDSSRRLGVDILSAVQRKHAFNATRPYRHGGKVA